MERFMLNSGGPTMTAVSHMTLNGQDAVVCKWENDAGVEAAAVFLRVCLTLM